MSHEREPTAREEWRANWPVVLVGALGMGLCTLHIYSQGLFMRPLEQEFGWTRAQVTLGPTLVSLLGACGALAAGLLTDRLGARRVAVPGIVIYSAAMAALSLSTGSLWLWCFSWVLVALGQPLISPTVWTSAVVHKFRRSRGLAMAVTLAGTSIGSGLTPIAVELLIEHFGWRAAYAVMPVTIAVVLLPLAFVFYREGRTGSSAPAGPQGRDRSALPGMTLKAGFRSGKFARLAVAGVLFSFALMAVIAHFVEILAEMGLNRSSAAAIAGGIGACSIVGRLATGHLLDRVHGPWIAAVAFATPAAAAAVLIYGDGSIGMAALAAILLGLSLGSEVDVLAYLSSRYFGLRHYGALYGTIVGVSALGVGAGPYMASLMHDAHHGYAGFLTFSVPIFLLGMVLVASLGRYPDFQASKEIAQPLPTA